MLLHPILKVVAKYSTQYEIVFSLAYEIMS